MKKRIFVALVALVVLIFTASSATAEETTKKTVGSNKEVSSAEVHPDGVVVTAEDNGYRPKPEKGDENEFCDDSGNEWQLYKERDVAQEVRQYTINGDVLEPGASSVPFDEVFTLASGGKEVNGRVFSETGNWWRCGGFILYPENGTVDVTGLVYEAIGSANPGEPTFTLTPDFGYTIVQNHSIFSINDDYWKPVTATASAGNVTTTAVLTPVKSIWDSGQRGEQPVTCEQGEARPKGAKRDFDKYPCTFKYTRASPIGEPYTITVNVEFAVTVTSNIGDLGTFPNLTMSATEPMEVQELQVLNVPNE